MKTGNYDENRLLHLLLDMGEMLLDSGAEIKRVEDTLQRIGCAYGAARMNVFVITSSIVITMEKMNGELLTHTKRVNYTGSTDFTALEQLNALSRNCCMNPIPMDQFQRRLHVETVVLLSQQKPDDTIEIDLDLDELDATSAELKATYQEIKDYVLKEFGLKVSSLYISQVKRKCGIEVGENYNLPKSENARVPQCPKEKEDAIKAALKYYAMI